MPADAGGEPTVLTKSDRERGDDRWPEFLPGGEAVLYTIIPATGGSENAQIAVLDLRTGTSKVLIRGGSHAHYVPTGHLVYGVMGTLRAVAFDLERLEVVGTAAQVVEGVVTTSQGAANVGVAANGSLVYVSGARTGGSGTVFSVDREGRSSPLPGLPLNSYRDVRVSPDGKRLALATLTDVWSYDLERATPSLVTTDPAVDRSPLWSLDGQRILFTSRRAGYPELFWRRADGTGVDERLLARTKDLIDLRRNRLVSGRESARVYRGGGERSERDRADGYKRRVPRDHAADRRGLQRLRCRFSGRRLDRLHLGQVRLNPKSTSNGIPNSEIGKTISTGGGMRPLWSRDGQELFFSTYNRQMLVAPVQLGTTLVFGRPQVLFEFAMVTSPGSRPVRHRPRWTVHDHRQWRGGRQRRPGDAADRGCAELAGRVEAPRARRTDRCR